MTVEQFDSVSSILERVMVMADVAYSPLKPAGILSGEFGDDLLAKFIGYEFAEGVEGAGPNEMFNTASQLMGKAMEQLSKVIAALTDESDTLDVLGLAKVADEAYYGGELQIALKDAPHRGDGLADYISHVVFEHKEKTSVIEELQGGCDALNRVILALNAASI